MTEDAGDLTEEASYLAFFQALRQVAQVMKTKLVRTP